jgi:hypothetical protein
MKKGILLSLLLFSTLNAGLFYNETEITTDNKKTDTSKNNIDIKDNNYIEQIDMYFSQSKYNKIIDLSETLMAKENIKMEDKQFILNYIFDKYINIFINKTQIDFSEKEEIIKFLYQISSKFNPEFKESQFNMALFKIIEGKDMVILSYTEDYIKKYFPRGIDDKDFFIKLYNILNSKLINKREFNIGRNYLNNFQSFIKNSNEYSEETLICYLQFGSLIEDFSGTYKDNASKIIANNKFSSDGYYFLALYYDKIKNEKSYKENIINSIKYNNKNAKSYYHYLHYCVNNNKNLESVLRIASYYFDNMYDPYYTPLIQFELAQAYFKIGTDKNNYDMVFKSYLLFKELNKTEYMKISKNICKNLDINRFKKDF